MSVHHFKYKLTMTLIDDLHTGSGLGTELINSLNTRDKTQMPVIWRQHIKGLLGQTRDRAQKLNSEHKYKSAFDKLLSNDSRDLSCTLIPGSFYYHKEDNPHHSDPCLIWANTARKGAEYSQSDNQTRLQGFNRAPGKGSLRSAEYIRAGSVFKSTWYLRIQDKEDIPHYREAFEVLLRRISQVGSKRNRGSGVIKLTGFDDVDSATTPIFPDAETAPVHHITSSNTDQLHHFVLTNLEPLRLPNTDVPGNIIPTHSHISGTQLTGAIAAWCKSLGDDELFRALVAGQFTLSYAYPSQSGSPSFPVPCQLQTTKKHSSGNLPWWATEDAPGEYYDAYSPGSQQQHENNGVQPKLKRLKSHYYFEQQNEHFHIHKQPVAIHMRNRVHREGEQDDSDLFSEEVLPENSTFTFTLRTTENSNASSELLSRLITLLKNSQNYPLQLGRGKAPCIVEQTTLSHLPGQIESLKPNLPFVLVLASPMVVYNPLTLLPYSRFDHHVLNQLADELLDSKRTLSLNEDDYQSFSEETRLVGYNFATGLPKKPLPCIAAGSSIYITNHAKAEKLRSLLSDHKQLGELQYLGLGSFWTYQEPLSLQPIANTPTYNDIKVADNKVESALSELMKVINKSKSKSILTNSNSPSKTQWQKCKQRLKKHKVTCSGQDIDIFSLMRSNQNASDTNWANILDITDQITNITNKDPDLSIWGCDLVIQFLTNQAEENNHEPE